jgi:hypothetical protein
MLMWPSAIAGFEDEQAINQGAHMIYATSHMIPGYTGYFGLNASTYFSSTGEGGVPCPTCGVIDNNATTWAINLDTGALVWHHAVASHQGYRGQTDVSGNVVYNVLSSGDISMVDATTGNLIRDYYVGAPMDQGVTIGASVNGQEYLLIPVGTCSFEAVATCPGTTSGDIVALTLSTPVVSPPTTSTSVTTTTSTTTSTTTVTAPGGPGSVSTTTSTTTVVSTTSTGSSNSTALYGVAAVAVIFIIATGYLAMRGRKPAS